MSKLMLLLSEVKGRAISAIWLSPESIELLDYVPRDDDLVPERTNEEQANLDGEDKNNKYVDELELCFTWNIIKQKNTEQHKPWWQMQQMDRCKCRVAT